MISKLLILSLFILQGFSLTADVQSPKIGARGLHNIHSIPASAYFATATGGNGNICSIDAPCALAIAISKLKDGDTLFLRGGHYHLKTTLSIPASGTKSHPIIIASYPHEHAILDGDIDTTTIQNGGRFIRDGIHIQGKKYIYIRNLEIKNMGARGVNILYSSYITIEGCTIHGNHLSGITVYGGNYDAPYAPYKYGYNTIKDNIVYNNSDAGINALQKQGGHTYSYEDGDNADGIAISSGKFNKVIHNTVFANADDGIDLWRSNNSYVAYNLVFDNGRGTGGNGNGIKAGGNRYFDGEEDAPNGKLALIEYNIAFQNKRIGFDINSGKKVTFRYNTSWNNGAQGFTSYDDTIVENNIAFENAKKTIIRKRHKMNSWQSDQPIHFMSRDYHSKHFLQPRTNINMGAYATKNDNTIKKPVRKANTHKSNPAKIFLIGDSTVHNSTQGEMGWGRALKAYMKTPKNLFNQARSGASSSSYKNPHIRHHDWAATKKLIQQTDCSKGGYLFIQFGHNNKDKNYAQFYADLKSYIKEARALGLIPVLITPVSRLYKYDKSHLKLPQIVRDVAEDEHVLLLDLNAKSSEVFNHYPSHDAIAKKFAYDDHTHFNPKGASIVAGWVKELACQKSPTLCTIFK